MPCSAYPKRHAGLTDLTILHARLAVAEVELPPELCMVCPVPHALWPALAALPRLMWQTEAALHADTLRRRLLPEGLPPSK